MPPPVIANSLVAGYDASTLGLANGATVSNWPDFGPNDYDLNSLSGSVIYETNSLSGMGGVRFVSNGKLTRTGITVPAPRTYFFVAKNPPLPPNDATPRIFSSYDSWVWHGVYGATGRWGFGNDAGAWIEFTDASLASQNTLWSFVYNMNGSDGGNGSKLRANRVQRAIGNNNGGARTALQLGHDANSGLDPSFIMYEYLVYDGVVSASDIDVIEAYLYDKWFAPGRLVDQTSAVRTTAGTPLSIAKPVGAVNGNWMIAFLFDDRSTASAWTPPAGGGWVQIFNSWTDNTDSTVAVFIRKIDGTEGAGPYAFTPTGSTTCGGWIQLWEGLDPLYPVVNFAYAEEAAVASMTSPFAGCAAVGFSAYEGSNTHPIALGGSGWSTFASLRSGIGDTAGGAGAIGIKENLGPAGTGSQGMTSVGAIAGNYQSIVLMLAPDWTTGGVTEAESPIEFAGAVAAFGSYTAPTAAVLTPDFSALPFETGDMLVATCWINDDVPTWTPPAGAGWTTRGNLSSSAGGDDRRLTIFTKPVVDGDDTTPEFTVSGGTGGPFAISVAVELWKGLDPVTPFEFIDTVLSVGNPSWWYLGAPDVLTPGAAIWQVFGAWTSAGNLYADPLHFTRRSDFSLEPDFTDRLIVSASRIVPNAISDFRQLRWAQTSGTNQDRLAFQMVMRPGLFEPGGITATELSCSEILVEWGSVAGADGYLVERSDDGVSGWVEVADTTSLDFTDTGLANDSEYFYRVTAYNESGDGGWSDVVSATTDALLPTTVIATAMSCFEIALDWDAVDCATGYRVERSADGSTGWVELEANTPATDFTNTGLNPGVTWFYRVTALNASGESVPSPVDSDTTDPLVAPTGVTLGIVNCSTISVEWGAVPCADSYTVEGSLDESTWVTVFAGPETEVEIGGRDCNTEYFIRVTAHTVVGPTTSPSSTVDSITTPVPLAPPGAGAEAPDCFEVHVEWLPAACANHYIVERSLTGSGGWTEVDDTTGSTFIDTDIECSTTYYYRITSYCGDAAGGISMTASALTPEPIPAFSVTTNCEEGGYVIEVNIPATYAEPVSVQRRDLETGDAAPVRGLQNLAPGTYTRIVDYEAPLDHAVTYDFNAGTPPAVTPVGSVSPVPFRAVCGEDTMYLRWLFDPSNMTGEFCLGTITEQEYQPRAGIFPVISRADPVVVVDEQETARGTLRFIAQTTAEVTGLRKVLTRSAQPTLLNMPSAYMLGKDGVLYFQPLSVREEWLNQDGRIPQHAFDVDYIEISRPPTAGVLERSGVRFGLREGGIAGGVTYPEGGWINWDTDPPDGAPHGDPDDRWPSFQDLVDSDKDFGEALFDTP